MTKYRLEGNRWGYYRLEYKEWDFPFFMWLSVDIWSSEPSDAMIRVAITKHEESERHKRKVSRFGPRYFRSWYRWGDDKSTELVITEPKANVKL